MSVTVKTQLELDVALAAAEPVIYVTTPADVWLTVTTAHTGWAAPFVACVTTALATESRNINRTRKQRMPDLEIVPNELYTVGELIARLQEFDPSLPVLIQSDPEGNGYFWGQGADADAYVPDETLTSDRSDECHSLESLKESLEDDDDPTEGYTHVVVLFPLKHTLPRVHYDRNCVSLTYHYAFLAYIFRRNYRVSTHTGSAGA